MRIKKKINNQLYQKDMSRDIFYKLMFFKAYQPDLLNNFTCFNEIIVNSFSSSVTALDLSDCLVRYVLGHFIF